MLPDFNSLARPESYTLQFGTDNIFVMKYIKVHTATRWTIRHGLMLLWFANSNRRYRQRLCLEAWHINSAHALLNRDDGGLLPDAYLHLVRKKTAN